MSGLGKVARVAASLGLVFSVFGPNPFSPLGQPTPTASAGNLAWSALRSVFSGGAVLGNGLAGQPDSRLPIDVTKNGHILVAGGAADGTIFRSTDGGKSWTSVVPVIGGTIVDIQPSPNYDVDNAILVLSSAETVCVVRDFAAGAICSVAGGAGGDSARSLAVATNFDATKNGYVAMGVTAAGATRLVYVNKYQSSTGTWTNDTGDTVNLWVNNAATDGLDLQNFAEAGGDSAFSLEFSPKYSSDETLVGLFYDASTGDVLSAKSQSNGQFGDPNGDADADLGTGSTEVLGVALPAASAATRAIGSIALPSNFDGTLANPRYFVGLGLDFDGNGTFEAGDVFEKGATNFVDTNAGGAGTATGISSLAISGEFTDAKLIAGVSNNARVLRSTDGADSWKAVDSIAEDAGPIGNVTANLSTQLAIAPDFASSSKVYATSNGDQGGLHMSTNGGADWMDGSLARDDHQENILDTWQYGASDYFIVTNTGTANENSVWKGSGTATATWQRVDRHSGVTQVRGSQSFAGDGTIFALRGNATAEQIIRCVSAGTICKATSGDPINRLMRSLAVLSATTLWVGDVDGFVWSSTDGGASWKKSTTDLGTAVLNVVISPNFAADQSLLAATVGDSGSYEVFLSTDGGMTWTQQGTSVGAWGTGTSSGVAGATGDYVALAFHPGFKDNKLIFAATLGAGDSIYRRAAGGTANWADTDPDSLVAAAATCPGIVDPDPHTSLVFGADGILYATSISDVDRISSSSYAETVVSPDNRGRWRCFNDVDASNYAVNGGLSVWSSDGANKVTVIDAVAGADDRLRLYTDTADFLKGPTIAQPLNNSTTPPNSGSEGQALTVAWNLMSLVTTYQYQIAVDENFDSVIVNVTGVLAAGASIAGGTLANGATYYLRVRALAESTDFHHSPWSKATKFAIGTLAAAQQPMPQLPADGSTMPNLGPTQLSWNNPAGTVQFHVQVLPLNNDGPAIDLIIGDADQVASASYTVMPPVFGQGNYVVLPGSTYNWRVRTTTRSGSLTVIDPNWGPWSDVRTYKTPRPSAATIQVQPVTPSATPTISWKDSNAQNFYYEVQLSQDRTFNADPATATAAVYWNLVHAGETSPLSSWMLPSGTTLEKGKTYYARVRQRVQATPLGADEPGISWSIMVSFVVP